MREIKVMKILKVLERINELSDIIIDILYGLLC